MVQLWSISQLQVCKSQHSSTCIGQGRPDQHTCNSTQQLAQVQQGAQAEQLKSLDVKAPDGNEHHARQ